MSRTCEVSIDLVFKGRHLVVGQEISPLLAVTPRVANDGSQIRRCGHRPAHRWTITYRPTGYAIGPYSWTSSARARAAARALIPLSEEPSFGQGDTALRDRVYFLLEKHGGERCP